MKNKLVILLAFLLISFKPNTDYCKLLYSRDKCGYYPAISVCVSPAEFGNSLYDYKRLDIWLGDKIAEKSIKHNKNHVAPPILLSFDYRIEGDKLFYLTSLVGPFSPPKCKIEEVPFFCLTDSIGTIRTLKEESCESRTKSQLVKKHVSNGDTLYTYNLIYEFSFDQPHITGLVFNSKFQIEEILFDTRGFFIVTGKEKCFSESIITFK
jgi:hypothetical protein